MGDTGFDAYRPMDLIMPIVHSVAFMDWPSTGIPWATTASKAVGQGMGTLYINRSWIASFQPFRVY